MLIHITGRVNNNIRETLVYSNQHESILPAALILRYIFAPPRSGGAFISVSLVASAQDTLGVKSRGIGIQACSGVEQYGRILPSVRFNS